MRPVTTPVPGSIEAIDGDSLLQVPPLTASLRLVVSFIQTVADPVIVPAFGSVITEIDADAVAVPQPLSEVAVYIMLTLPIASPETTPVDALTVAKAVLLLLQVPLISPVLENAVEVPPTHTVAGPLTIPALANGFTIITAVTDNVVQLLVTEYVIVVEPAATPVTTPVEAFTVATAVLLLLQVPPASPVLVNGVVPFTHTVVDPLITPRTGKGLMVILAEAV